MQTQTELIKPCSVATIRTKTPESALSHLMAEKQAESRIQKARRIMGEEVEILSDEELDIYLIEFQHLIDLWLDIFEKQTFDNKTLSQLLREV